MRIDDYLMQTGRCRSRAQGKDFVKLGLVKINGVEVKKPSKTVNDGDVVEVLSIDNFVSRGALKLKDVVEEWGIAVKDLVVADIGASTGGFSDFMLQQGVAKIFAIDVGTGQLDEKVKNNHKVVEFEGVDVREIGSLGELVDMAVIDVSFISLAMILEKVWSFLKEKGVILALFKPQFEVGKDFVGKDGVVKNETKIKECLEEIKIFAEKIGLVLEKEKLCKIKGKRGNGEYWLYFRKV